MTRARSEAEAAQLALYWIPLGAGARVVRTSGKIYERCMALAQRRAAQPLFHSALVADTAKGRFHIEMTPVPRDGTREQRGVVGGAPWAAGRSVTCASSGTRTGAGSTASSLTSATPSTARSSSPSTPRGPAGPRAVTARSQQRLGPRRDAHRGDVELELCRRLDTRTRRSQQQSWSTAPQRSRTRLGRRHRRRPPPATYRAVGAARRHRRAHGSEVHRVISTQRLRRRALSSPVMGRSPKQRTPMVQSGRHALIE